MNVPAVYPLTASPQANNLAVYPQTAGVRTNGSLPVYPLTAGTQPNNIPVVGAQTGNYPALAGTLTGDTTAYPAVAGLQPNGIPSIPSIADIQIYDPTAVFPAVAGAQTNNTLTTGAPTAMGVQMNTGPTIYPINYPSGSYPTGNYPNASGPAYYVPSSSQPIYLSQSSGGADPSRGVGPRTAGPTTVVNPALYPNGVILTPYRSPSPYNPPRYIVRPAPPR
jgi:hypothetical protein